METIIIEASYEISESIAREARRLFIVIAELVVGKRAQPGGGVDPDAPVTRTLWIRDK